VVVFGDASTINTITASQNHQFLARASGGVAYFTNSTLTSGALLPIGGGSWLNLSDVRTQTAFRERSGEAVLAQSRAMPMHSWQYKSQAASIRHIAPHGTGFSRRIRCGRKRHDTCRRGR